MQTKGRIMLMVIAGGYLAYLGGGLVTDAMKEKPENYILYTVVGVLFLIIGAACCLFNLKKYIKHEYRDPFKDAIEEDEASEEDAEPSKVMQTNPPKSRQMISSLWRKRKIFSQRKAKYPMNQME